MASSPDLELPSAPATSAADFSALARVARLAAAATGAPWAMVTLVAPEALAVAAAHGLPAEVRPGVRFRASQAPCFLTVALGRVVASDDLAADPVLGPRRAVQLLGARAYLGAPFRDGAGRVLGTVCVMAPEPRAWTAADAERVTDLAALVEAEFALRRGMADADRARAEEARFRALVEHTSELIVLLAADGRATYASPAITRVLGRSPEGLLGWGAVRLLHPDEVRATRAALADLLREPGGHREMRLRAREAHGGWRTLHVVAEHLAGDPTLGAVVVTARDVTQQAALEAQLGQVQKLEALGRLAGGVAHDFNNLLTVLGTSARFVRDAVADALPPALASEALADLHEIDRAVERAGALTRQLLAFSRARASEARPTSLADVVRGVEKMAQRVVGDDIEVVSLADAAAGQVLADPGQLEQVLLNLVVNARDAMPDGGVLILESRRADLTAADAARDGVAAGAWSVLEVTDTGVGMSEATQARIFEPFFTTKPEGQGTGLGLATVYGIVSQAGGHVRVHSQPGRGTTFTVLLPRVADDALASDDAEASRPAPLQARRGRGELVLVVEDEAGVRHVARRVLERHGYRVLDARHGAEALRLWHAHGGPSGAVHLVLTDLTMPELGGRELVTRLLAHRASQPVVVMTGYASADPPEWAERAGLVVVQKPFNASALARAVRAAIDGTSGAVARAS